MCAACRPPLSAATAVEATVTDGGRHRIHKAMVGAHLISAVCALGCALATWTHYNLMPPPRLKAPVTTRLAGSLTYLTVQSNWIMTCYHMLRFLLPGNYLAQHAFPLAFALGFNLTLLYYGLNHFVAEKRRMDAEWIGKGWRRIPLGNHLEHGLALPCASATWTFEPADLDSSSPPPIRLLAHC